MVNADDVAWESWSDPAIRARSAVRWQLLLTRDRTPSAGMTMGRLEILPGACLLRHHHALQESYYILEGTGTLEVDGQISPVGPGATIYIAPNARHRLVNSGPTTLRLLFMFPADSFDEVVYHFEE
jgi:quercetin dioxygenase-like cupin family protein